MRDPAWQSLETNRFGTDEFIRLCRAMDWTPMLAVNLGTGTPEEARDWVEYCNGAAGRRCADMRAANGSRDPHNVKLWCLGNEMDGLWQLGHTTADQYATRARCAAQMMRGVDPSIEVVACGSCSMGLPTYLEWDRQVLEHCGDTVDYLSMHRYVGNAAGDTADFLAVAASIDRQIEEMDAVCRFVQARLRSKKRVLLCFDEWNVWYRATDGDGKGKTAPHLLEEVYNLEDALVAAGFLQSFIRHADVVKIANLAQIVNVIAPVLTQGDRTLVQSIFYPFEMISRRRDGSALRVAVDGPCYESRSHGTIAFIDASAILGAGRLHVFLANRSPDEAAEVRITIADRAVDSIDSAEILTGPGPKAGNSFESPDVVTSTRFEAARISRGSVLCQLPPLSFVAASLNLA